MPGPSVEGDVAYPWPLGPGRRGLPSLSLLHGNYPCPGPFGPSKGFTDGLLHLPLPPGASGRTGAPCLWPAAPSSTELAGITRSRELR